MNRCNCVHLLKSRLEREVRGFLGLDCTEAFIGRGQFWLNELFILKYKYKRLDGNGNRLDGIETNYIHPNFCPICGGDFKNGVGFDMYGEPLTRKHLIAMVKDIIDLTYREIFVDIDDIDALLKSKYKVSVNDFK